MIRVGPAGWAYKDWAGIVYPAKKPRGFHEASFLAHYFDTIEINVSFYRPLPASTTKTWLDRVAFNPNFRFTAKLWKGFTHDCAATEQDEAEFKAGMIPLLESGRLGALLLQFPWSFRNTPENLDVVVNLVNRFREYPLVLEVRHSSWTEGGILDILSHLGVSLCNIDQPLFKSSIAPAAIATSDIGYIRLHGRNYKSWWTENEHTGERYNYLYSVEELDPWIDRIQTVAQSAEDTYVVTNNHYLGKAVVNATEISSILQGKPVEAPATLVQNYPELMPYTLPAGQQSLLP